VVLLDVRVKFLAMGERWNNEHALADMALCIGQVSIHQHKYLIVDEDHRLQHCGSGERRGELCLHQTTRRGGF
jgi:hypothetical protein